ncbi:MAG: VWA domain-containing protein [Anaerolineae bacterium]|nr:VWA domain-containing protein [Anaerolineae bacterium]
MSFTNPNALWLLLLLPVFIAVGWPRLAYRRRRDIASLLIRLLLVSIVILGLAGIQIQRTADKLAVVFLIDVSDSIAPAVQSAALDYVRTSVDAMEERDQAAVIVFGANALVEIPITEELELVQIGSAPIRLNTDLAEAIRLGLALFPADTAKRLIILSDGKQTVGDAEEVARLAAATAVRIDYIPLTPTGPEQQIIRPEVSITDVDVPVTVNEGEEFDLTVTIVSNRRDSLAEVRVLSAGSIIHREEIELQTGENTYVFPDIVVPSAGFTDFRVVVEPRGADNFYQNNELSAFTEVTGPPRVLLVTTDEREIESLRDALEQTGLRVEVQGPHDLPLGLAPLSSYDSIVLANVPATELTPDRMAFLQAYVRDLGGGLVTIGGPNSYGVGGYFETPLEEALPVEMQLRDKERIPQLTMLFVVDRSGSMEIASPSGVSNLELAKEAIVRSFDLLTETDRTGVISFDINAYFVLDIQDVGDALNRERMRAEVGSLRPGGGTNIRQGVLSADTVLRDDPSQLKHIILLTDGGSDPSGIAPAVDRMYENYGITTSVVAVGQDYTRWLQEVAEAGRGQFHLAYDIATIPAIFTAETLLATRSYIFEEEFQPTITARHPIIRGLDSLPPLNGYVATTGKDTAIVILRGPENDPILAAWQYGLGRSVAFTSDATSRWAADWIGWGGYLDFWSQAIRWTISEDSSSNLELHITQRGEQAVLVANARDAQGNYLNGLLLDASVITTDLQAVTLRLQQTAPGRYEASFTPEDEGSYFITVAGSTAPSTGQPGEESVIQTTGWVLSYSAEYRVDLDETDQQPGITLLERIAAVTEGESLRTRPEDAFLHNLDQERAARPVWPILLLAAVFLLPVDIAIRRLVITQSDIDKIREMVANLLGVKRWSKYDSQQQTSSRLGRLMDAKDRARAARTQPQQDERVPRPMQKPGTTTPPTPRRPRSRRTAPPPTPQATRQPPEQPKYESGSLASRLLERRKTQDKEQDQSNDQ